MATISPTSSSSRTMSDSSSSSSSFHPTAAASSNTSNLLAVELLRQGYPVQAQHQLKAAIASVRDGLAQESAATTTTAPQQALLQSVDIPAAPRADADLQDSWFAMYQKAFVLVTPAAAAPDSTHVTLQSIVLMYNMALATHVMGLTQGSEALLKRALRVYQRVQWLLTANATTLDATTSMMLSVISLACDNNQGHIYNLLLNDAGVKSCHSRLQATVNAVQRAQAAQQAQTQEEAAAAMIIDPQDMAFFSFTVIIWGPALEQETATILPLAPAA